jgi:hypothetical protein
MRNRLQSSLILFLAIFGLLFHHSDSEAATVTKVKNDSVAISLESENEIEENKLYLVMVGGKKKAVVKVTKVRGQKALGKVLKGQAVMNGTLQLFEKNSAKNADSKKSKSSSLAKANTETQPKAKRYRRRRFNTDNITFGLLVGLGNDTQTITNTSTNNSEALSGNGTSAKAFVDMPLAGSTGAIARVGIEKFNASSSNFSTEIQFTTVDLLLRYNLIEAQFTPFIQGGLGVFIPGDVTTNAIDEANIGPTTVILGGLGFNYYFDEFMYVQAHGEYSMFPPSESVFTSIIAARLGVGFSF